MPTAVWLHVGPKRCHSELLLRFGDVGAMGFHECYKEDPLPPQHPPVLAQTPATVISPFFPAVRALEDTHLAEREAEAQKERDPVQSLGEVCGSGLRCCLHCVPIHSPVPWVCHEGRGIWRMFFMVLVPPTLDTTSETHLFLLSQMYQRD